MIDAGLHCSVRLSTIAQQEQFIAAAAEVGVEVDGLTRFWLPHSAQQAPAAGLVLGFGGVDEAAIANAVKALDKAWR